MKGLTNNQLKILALVTMTVDHIGAYLFPYLMWLRIIGRLAFPIFAYMIAEGCRHTRSMGKYFATMAVFALVVQGVDLVARGSLYMSILVTFSMSIGIIWLMQKAKKTRSFLWVLLGVTAVAAAYFICEILPGMLPDAGFGVDYGFIGVMIPALVFLGKNKWQRILVLAVGLSALVPQVATIQWYALLAILPLALYNGQRGKWNLKWLFYIYYPAHLVAIYGISFLL